MKKNVLQNQPQNFLVNSAVYLLKFVSLRFRISHYLVNFAKQEWETHNRFYYGPGSDQALLKEVPLSRTLRQPLISNPPDPQEKASNLSALQKSR
jgi:hypothetical protein